MNRRKRNTKQGQEFDPLKSVTIADIGTENDPCFGKHHSNDALECQRCGDQILCATVCLQKTRVKFLDTGEYIDTDLDIHIDPLLWEKPLKGILRKTGPIPVKKALKILTNKMDPMGNYDKLQVKKTVISIVKENSDLVTFKEGKIRYIKIK